MGALTAILHWVNRGRRDQFSLHVGGLELSEGTELTWPGATLSVGDEIGFRIVHSADMTPPRVRRTSAARESVEKQEMAYPRKTAKKYGYKLVKV